MTGVTECVCEATCYCPKPDRTVAETAPDPAALLRDLVRTAPMKIDGERMTWLGASCRFIAAFSAARAWVLSNPSGAGN